ncbi:MAG: hypothetical protein BWY07_02516 [Candidatus Hydrogenedentes bacterium ADurb.Bin170]|jgi:hypothetical protein|nr:MAG: hypothetical protein BWY07_02516 [Candidatus Hydrogenedentes bacterium ADurb.Bin170]
MIDGHGNPEREKGINITILCLLSACAVSVYHTILSFQRNGTITDNAFIVLRPVS